MISQKNQRINETKAENTLSTARTETKNENEKLVFVFLRTIRKRDVDSAVFSSSRVEEVRDGNENGNNAHVR
jgi:hypothetical protein